MKALIVDIDKERGLSEESLRRFFSIYLDMPDKNKCPSFRCLVKGEYFSGG